jgi:hypothetical protein
MSNRAVYIGGFLGGTSMAERVGEALVTSGYDSVDVATFSQAMDNVNRVSRMVDR